jgi:thioredoxin 1
MEETNHTPEKNNPELELLDFWAVWCGPCKIMDPVLDEIEHEYKEKLAIRKINIDEEEAAHLVEQYQIMSVPTYILVKGGEVVDHFVGVTQKNAFTQKIDAALGQGN